MKSFTYTVHVCANILCAKGLKGYEPKKTWLHHISDLRQLTVCSLYNWLGASG